MQCAPQGPGRWISWCNSGATEPKEKRNLLIFSKLRSKIRDSHGVFKLLSDAHELLTSVHGDSNRL
jgi:hypothetical protein